MKKTIVFDFDGVIHSYTSGWQGVENIPDEPVAGIKEVIDALRQRGYEVVIVSTRSATMAGTDAILNWLKKHNIEVDRVCSVKPPALVYVDDRAITFNGSTDGLLEQIVNFRSWTEQLTSKET